MSSVAGMFRRWRAALGNLSASHPSAALLAGMLAAVSGGIDGYIHSLAVIPLVILALLTGGRAWARVLCGFAAGWLALYLNSLDSPNDYSRIIARENCGAELRVRVVDTSCAGEGVAWLDNPSMPLCRVEKIRLTPFSDWRKADGKVTLRLPEGFHRLSYGEELLLRGAFVMPRGVQERERRLIAEGSETGLPPRAVSGFDFGYYLRTRGVERVFNCVSAETLGMKSSLMSALLSGRNFLLRRMGVGVADDADRRILAALVFGCRQGLDWKTRQEFIRTGVVHVFTVSGFHVGILALLCFWLMRPLPFRARCFSVIPVLLLYVASTGMNPPALRSLIMVSIWALCRGMLLRTPGLNIIFMAAVLILFFNPLYLNDAGFQYSFVVVGFLVAASGPIRAWVALSGDKARWTPPAARRPLPLFFLGLRNKSLAGLLGCAVAWLASSGISLQYQGFYFPMAVLLNFIVIPFVWLIFATLILKLLLAPLAFMAVPLGGVLQFLCGVMGSLCGSFSEFFELIRLPEPSAWTLVCFYAALSALIAASSRLSFCASLLTLSGICFFWHMRQCVQLPTLELHYGGGEVPALLLSSGGTQGCTVVNVPSRQVAAAMADSLRVRGLKRIDRLLVTSPLTACLAGAETLLAGTGVGVLITPDGRGKTAAALTAAAAQSGCRVITRAWDRERGFDYRDAGFELRSYPGMLETDYRAAGFRLDSVLKECGDGGGQLELSNASWQGSFIFPHGINTHIMEYYFK